mmetsp:Transcript_29644/g.65709  ORF Transcript_29644/g.65709 Transcript_29644/m.65709 type:complete len:442 (+) Transcript_29644:54-1379(+)
MGYAISCASVCVMGAIFVGLGLRFMPRAFVPAHLAGHAVYQEDKLITENQRLQLLDLIRDTKTYASNVDQAKATGFVPTYEHLGEAQPIQPDGSCSHSYLFPNHDKTLCVLPERVDVGRHFIQTGGLDGVKENFYDLVSRVSSFSRFTFAKDFYKYPLVQELFDSETFQTAAKSVCPQNSSHLDPFQFSFILSVPGQTVAVHLDAPYFWGASRYRFPQWLLVAMVFSGLFQDRFINQIQVVGYLHDWTLQDGAGASEGGDFVYYKDANTVGVMRPAPGSGTIVDGSKVLHAAKIYRAHSKAPRLPKDRASSLIYVGGDRWELQTDGEMVHQYSTSDLRISIVYRARCFSSPAEAQRYSALPQEDMLSLEYVMGAFKRDLTSRGKGSPLQLEGMPPLDFLFLIIDTYITYPLPPWEFATIPYNYCALSRLMPWTAPLLRLLC